MPRSMTPGDAMECCNMDIPPDVEEMFNDAALSLIAKGWRRFSADAILHHIRWQSRVERGSTYKVNNNWSSELSRRFARSYPQHASFFERRQLLSGGGRKESATLWLDI